jgi:hypothetical protein
MSHAWSAEITNDPEQDYDLIIELLENDLPRGRLHTIQTGETILTIYPCAEKVVVDLDWVIKVMKQSKL